MSNSAAAAKKAVPGFSKLPSRLLVVSLEVPRTFDELLETMRGFVAFAICFLMLMLVWSWHYTFFRRYGLQDTFVVILNGIPQIDSSGISTLVRISIQLAREGGVLRLVCGPGRVRDALTVTRLVEAIPTFESESAALSKFA